MMEDWQTNFLEDVVKFIDYRGKTPEKTEDGLRLITAKNVKMGYLQNEPMEFVDPKIYDKWMTRGIPHRGDVLFTTEAPLGNVTQLDTDEKVVFAQRVIIFQPNQGILDSTFLKYMLLSDLMQERIQKKGTGATVKGIKAQLLKKIPISFPRTLAEQKRIVSIVDEAFEGIDRAIANTEKNLTNARELFKGYLNAVFTQKSDGWVEKKIEEVCESIIDCINKTAVAIDEPSPFKMIRTTNVRNGLINLNSVKYVTEDTYHKWTRRQTPKRVFEKGSR